MTVVNIDLRHPGPAGARTAAGRVAWTPVERHVSGSYVLLPARMSTPLVEGAAVVTVEPGLYWVEEKTAGGVSAFRLVPAGDTVNYSDLPEVDPATLEPTAAPDPAWVAMARATVTSGEVVDGELILSRTDGGTVNAGPVKGEPGANGKDAVVDQATLWRSDWVTPYARSVMEPPALVDTPAVSYFAGEVTALTTPVEYKIKGVGGATQVTGWDGQDDPAFRFAPGVYNTSNGGSATKAMYGSTKPGGASQAAEWPLMVSFTTTSQTVEVFFYSKATTTTPLVKVEGRQLTDVTPVRAVTGNSFTMTLTFPTARARTIEVCGTGALGMMGARVTTGLTITKPPAPKRRVAIIGDSYVNGAGTVSSGPASGAGTLETFAPRLARLLGADSTILAGIGGTGWVAGMDGATPNPYSTRLATVLAMAPHVLVFYGSVNDGTTGAGVQAAVTSVLNQCAAVPEVYVIGPLLNGYSATNAAVKAGTLAAGRVFIDMGDFMYGTGKVDAPKGDGNRDFFLYTDGIHPTLAAHKAIAESAFRRIYARNQ